MEIKIAHNKNYLSASDELVQLKENNIDIKKEISVGNKKSVALTKWLAS